MSSGFGFDEDLVRRLPLPLAQLYRRAHNSEDPLKQHVAAVSTWELALKLLASTAIIEYAEQRLPDPAINERLENLARPQLGHWRELARLLVALLAQRGDQAFQEIQNFLADRMRDDLPRAAGLQAAISKTLHGKETGRATVRLAQLFDDLVQYRNKTIGHGALSQLRTAQHQHMAAALLGGLTDILRRLDVLAGRRLVYVGGVRQESGCWLIERFELIGDRALRVEPWRLPRDIELTTRLPDANRVYLENQGLEPNVRGLHSFHPLVIYEPEAEEILILNGRKAKGTEYLCYTTGLTSERADMAVDARGLLADALRMSGNPPSAKPASAPHAPAQPHVPAEPPPRAHPAGEPARHVGEFELISELGEGGMGVVYRAWQPSLRRQVALKVISRLGAKAEARFSREIEALGRVDHPHVVKAFTSGSDGEIWYYAMELVEGVPLSVISERLQAKTSKVTEVNLDTWQTTLSSACKESREGERRLRDAPIARAEPSARLEREPSGPAPAALRPGHDYTRRIVELMVQAADACHALHQAGVVHRDIKPGNIMVKSDGRQAVLVDLGVAQLADDVDGKLTRTRELVGTLRYASPQQVLAVGSLDRRTDIYSLGVTMWELLTLRPFLDAGDDTPVPVLMEKIQREEPAPLRTYHPGISRDLEAVVHKCVEKDPKPRYATAADLAADLTRFLNGEPVLARPSRLKKMRRRLARQITRTGQYLPYAGLVVLALFAWAIYMRSRASLKNSPSEGWVIVKPAPRNAGKNPGASNELTRAEYTEFERLTAGHFPEEKWEFHQELLKMNHANRLKAFEAMQNALQGKSQIVLTRGPQNRWRINIGRLRGVKKGSVLAVYPPGNQPQGSKPLAYVQVSSSRMADSVVAPMAYAGLSAREDLPNRGNCVLVKLDFGDFRVPVMIEKTAVDGTLSAAQQDRLAKIERELTEQAKHKESPFRMTPDRAVARWVFQYRGAELSLFATDPAQQSNEKSLPGNVPLFRIPQDQAEANVATELTRIIRAQNLLAVARQFRAASSAFESDLGAPRVRLDLLKCKDQEDKYGEVVPPSGREPTFSPGDYVAFRVTNEGRIEADCSLVYVDSEFKVFSRPIRPRDGRSRLKPRESFDTPAYRINAKTAGHGHALVIAVRAKSDQSADFGFLEVNNTGPMQGRPGVPGPDKVTSYDSSLGKLLRKAAFGESEGTTRSLTTTDIQDYDLRMLSWIVVKK